MNNTTDTYTIKDLILTTLILAGLVVSCYMCVALLQPTSGQGMSMPFIGTIFMTIVLQLTYIVMLVCDVFLHKKSIRYIAILTHIGIVVYTINRFLYNYDYRHNWTKERFEGFDGYPPLDENYWVIAIFCTMTFIYCNYKIVKEKK